MGNFKEDIAKAEALVFDVDGVFTDSGITLTPDGDFLRTYNTKDGFVVRYAIRQGLKIYIITGGGGSNIMRRFTDLGVTGLFVRSEDKLPTLMSIIEKEGYDPRNVIYMGDDVPDIPCLTYVGIPVCPRDAVSDVVERCRYISEMDGGRGCVRDIIEQVLRAKGLWSETFSRDDLFGLRSV